MNSNSSNKTVLITGATSGIGKEAVLLFAEAGYDLVLLNRNKEKADHLCDIVKKSYPKTKLTTYLADFSDLDRVKNAAEQIALDHKSIDILISNAAILDKEGATLPNGLETNFTVNYMAAALIVMKLKPIMSDYGRILMVTSVAHKQGKLNYDGPGKTWIQNYGNSKLAINLLVNKVAEQWQQEGGVCINMVHPGVVATDIFFKTGWKKQWLSPLVGLFMKSADKAAKEYFYLVTSDDLKKVTGTYFVNNKPSKQGRNALDVEVQNALNSWTISFFNKNHLL